MAPPKDSEAILKQFREGLVQQELIHDGDSIGTDDETLLYAPPFLAPVCGGSLTLHDAAAFCAPGSGT